LLLAKHAEMRGEHTAFQNDEVAYISIGDGTTSEGEFWESLSTACVRKLPVLFVVEDNGYAISVPVEVQVPGGDFSRLVEHYPGLKTFKCDGTDFQESYQTMTEAVAHCRARKGPALVHAKVIRPYSHSLSDDEKLYKTAAERAEEATRDPITKFARLLKDQGLVTDAELAAMAKDVDREVGEAADAAVKRKGRRRIRPDSGSTRRTLIPRLPRSTPRWCPPASRTRWSRPSIAR
jgi:2-oxoisovalerate dehydrogenase E1 component